MRTTFTIESAVAERLQKILAKEETTLNSLVNRVLREGLSVIETDSKSKKPYRFVVTPHDFGGLKPGIDPNRIGQWADDLEDQEIVARLRAR